jgi:hypothetical protein
VYTAQDVNTEARNTIAKISFTPTLQKNGSAEFKWIVILRVLAKVTIGAIWGCGLPCGQRKMKSGLKEKPSSRFDR